MKTRWLVPLAAVVLGAPAPVLAAVACKASSGPLAKPLVELYTSEGCDSCPPADRWLSATFAGAAAPALAIAFHVDYWDRLGWKDRFANPAYTARQQRAADANGSTFVYTPQLLLDGRDLKWQNAKAAGAISHAAAEPARASIEVTAERVGDTIKVNAAAQVADRALRNGTSVALAYVDSGLVSEVKAGENRGVRLVHDHVVRAFAVGGTIDANGRLVAEARLPVPAEAGGAPAIVAFVQRERTGEVLQALSLPLTDCPLR